MPYLQLCLSMPESLDVAEMLVGILMRHTSEILGKKPEVTSINVEFVAPDRWFVGGVRMSDRSDVTFYLDIKVTDGTNTKDEKAKYVKHVFRDVEVS